MFIIKKAVSWSIIRPRNNSLFVRTNVIEVYSRVKEDLVFHLWLTFQIVQSRLVQYYFIRKFRWGICWFAKWIVDTQFCYPPVYELRFTKKPISLCSLSARTTTCLSWTQDERFATFWGFEDRCCVRERTVTSTYCQLSFCLWLILFEVCGVTLFLLLFILWKTIWFMYIDRLNIL